MKQRKWKEKNGLPGRREAEKGWKRWWSFGWPTPPPLLFVSLFFFLVRSVLRGEERLVFCYGVLGKILKVPLVSLCPSPSLCFPCFVCALPLLAPMFFSVFVSWVHPCSKSLSISLCLTLPCICPFFFLFCEFVLWRRGWICGTLAFSSSPLFFFPSLSLFSLGSALFFSCSWLFFVFLFASSRSLFSPAL